MSEKKADKQRYWVTILLKDLPEGSTFKPDALHLTIIPWFVSEKSNEEVIKSFIEQFSNQRPFKVGVGEVIEFKSRRKIPVNLIKSTYELFSLHERSLNWFSSLEGRWAVKSPYVDKEYIPHIRRRPGHNLNENDELSIKYLYLVGAYRRGDDLRTVVSKVNFHE